MENLRLPTIKKILRDLDYYELRNIATSLNIKGRSKMGFKELVESISSILKNEELVLDILKGLNENALQILDIMRDYDGIVDKKKVLQEFGKSQHTFRKYLQILQSYGLVFYNHEENTLYVSKESMRFINNFIMEKEEKMDFSDFLNAFLTVGQLKYICSKFNLPVSGRKEELINRVTKSSVSERKLLESLTLYELKEIAEFMGLNKSGRKSRVIDRILSQIKVSKIKEYKVTSEKLSSPTTKMTFKRNLDALLEEIAEAIDKEFQPIKPVSARLKERQVENDLYQFLRGKFYPKHKIEIEKTKRESRIDLSVDGKIGIELKYATRNKPIDSDKIVGQVERYLADFPRLILIICLQGADEKLIRKANSVKARSENKGAKVIIKVV